MRKTIALFTLLLFVLAARPQNVDGGATELLRKVSAQYRNYSSMQFNYTLKSTLGDKTLSVSKGSVKVKGEKYTTSFDDQLYVCDGESVWNFQKSTNEVSVFEYDPEDSQNIMNPQKILSGWEKHFKAKFIRDDFENNVQVSIIDLTPKTQQSYYRIRLFVQKGSLKISKVALYEKDNTIYTYNIEQFKSNVPFDDSVFVFDTKQYPGVEVNDMR